MALFLSVGQPKLLRGVLAQLQDAARSEDSGRIDRLRVLEELSCAAAGAQARIGVDFGASQRAAQRAAGTSLAIWVGVSGRDRVGAAGEPEPGGPVAGLAHAVAEMVHTRAAWDVGEITEWRAAILARETGCLSWQDRGLADGGETTLANSQGLCTACNQAKEAPGWTAHTTDTRTGDEVQTTTPTGHTYRSRPPPAPSTRPPPSTVMEIAFCNLLLAA